MFVDVIEYSDVKRKFYYKNRNFEEVLTCIAFKFDITFNCTIGTKVIKKPKFKQTKIFICKKCFDYFKVKISLKQIGFFVKTTKRKVSLYLYTYYTNYIYSFERRCRGFRVEN